MILVMIFMKRFHGAGPWPHRPDRAICATRPRAAPSRPASLTGRGVSSLVAACAFARC